jgi:hypothetical protein
MFSALMKAFVPGLAIAIASLAAGPALAQEPITVIIEGKPVKKDRTICRTTAPQTGTRLGQRRICRTAFEWKMIEQRSQNMIERGQLRERAVQAYNENAKNGLARQTPP